MKAKTATLSSLLTLFSFGASIISAQPHKKLHHVTDLDARDYLKQYHRHHRHHRHPHPHPHPPPPPPQPPPPSTLTTWDYNVRGQDGNTYTGKIVGPPLTGSTTVPTPIIPVVITIVENGTTYVFDPTQRDSGCLGTHTALDLFSSSPLFVPVPFDLDGVPVGTTQYVDAIMRGEFNQDITPDYHVLLGQQPATPLRLTFTDDPNAAVENVSGQCGNPSDVNPANLLAVVNITNIDNALLDYIAANGFTPGELPFFLLYNTVMSLGAPSTGQCCVLGYHNAESVGGQTYTIADFEGRDQTVFAGTSDVSAASHEAAEWANDPYVINPTPPWGNIGQVGGCQTNLEVGDPLTGHLHDPITLNGFSFHVQEEAYFNWFYGPPSHGTAGYFSSNGTFTGAAKPCPPGGTN